MAVDVRVRAARSRSDFDACVDLQRAVWRLSDLEITSAMQMIATAHAGGLVQLAERPDGRIVGFAHAFPALRGGVSSLHSDMLAVLPEEQSKGVGVTLKWAQREQALERGVAFITWTYDPLQARNASLNLRRLGALAPEFQADFYGITTSSLHHGLPTDRLIVRWDLDSPRARERATVGKLSPTIPAPPFPRVNEVKWQAGWPISSEPRRDLTAPEVLLEIPPDWNGLCEAIPPLAAEWHGFVRSALSAYFTRGYVAADFVPTEEGGRRRFLYVLRKA